LSAGIQEGQLVRLAADSSEEEAMLERNGYRVFVFACLTLIGTTCLASDASGLDSLQERCDVDGRWGPHQGAPVSILCFINESPESFPPTEHPEEPAAPWRCTAEQFFTVHVSQSGALTVVSYEISECDPPPPAASHDSSESLTGATAPSPTPKEEAAAGIDSGSGLGVNQIETTG
jgi:hypothetical protein